MQKDELKFYEFVTLRKPFGHSTSIKSSAEIMVIKGFVRTSAILYSGTPI
jgi:hypothetical protein